MPFRYAERFSGTSPPRRIVYFFSAQAFQRNKIKQKMQKSIRERSCKVEHDNARSEGTRKGWEGRGLSDKAKLLLS